mgnify:CR=1 FL=1
MRDIEYNLQVKSPTSFGYSCYDHCILQRRVIKPFQLSIDYSWCHRPSRQERVFIERIVFQFKRWTVSFIQTRCWYRVNEFGDVRVEKRAIGEAKELWKLEVWQRQWVCFGWNKDLSWKSFILFILIPSGLSPAPRVEWHAFLDVVFFRRAVQENSYSVFLIFNMVKTEQHTKVHLLTLFIETRRWAEQSKTNANDVVSQVGHRGRHLFKQPLRFLSWKVSLSMVMNLISKEHPCIQLALFSSFISSQFSPPLYHLKCLLGIVKTM